MIASVRRQSAVPAVILAMGVWFLSPTCSAQDEDTNFATVEEAAAGGIVRLVDRIVAIVDEEMILQSDLDRELEAYNYERQLAGEEVSEATPELRAEILERLIEAKLIIAAAKQAELVIEDEAVQAAVDDRITQMVEYFGSRDTLEQELLRAGMTLDDYESRLFTQIRDQQYMKLVIGRFIRPNVEVMENEVEEYFQAHRDELPQQADSLTVSNILIPVQPSNEVRQEIQRQVQLIDEELAKGRSFADVAGEFSQGPNANRGGAVGVVRPGDLFDPALDQAVFAMSVGEVSQPVVSSRGVHIVRLDAVVEQDGHAISQIFLPMEVTDDDVDRAERLIKEARDRIERGEPFSLVASDMSGDPASAANGGLLGTFALEDLSAQFQEVLKDAQPGELTEPILTNVGWYLFLVNERIPGHDYTFDEVKDEIRRRLEAEKMEEKLTEYVQDLRTRFFVDRKG